MSDIKYLRVDTRELNKDLDELQRLTVVLNDAEKNMIEQIRQLNSMWTGKANSAFNVQFDIDCSKFEQLRDTIKKYREKLAKARTEYNRCDSKVNDIVNSIKV